VKLTKPQIKAHREAMALVDCDRRLHDEEKEFILDNFHEGATHINSSAGAFFTPRGLARDFAIEVDGGTTDKSRCIDLCAGIGSLSYAVEQKVGSLVCVEMNPEYARIGKRIVPAAEWIVCSVFDPCVIGLGRFR
jgi:predicted RNA methylase